MNKQELVEEIKKHAIYHCGEKECYKEGCTQVVDLGLVLEIVNQLDEPSSGHAEEAPRYVKNVLARLRELPLHDREVWLKAIMSEFERDFSHAIWREGYEQGKFEGMLGYEKVTIPQFVADWLSNLKSGLFGLNYDSVPSEIYDWVYATKDNLRKLHLAFVYGYEVEKEKRYLVKIRATKHYFAKDGNRKIYFSLAYKSCFTKKELEEAGFGWVFSCEGVEVKKVEE
ncbi:DUF1642 domain-containing protein [uncultured Streptococcus sp.]|uniref:DUF1642 domain-containing protein n=1 Tax=uncultured Streptococcus sp. TaxID=83427 RepID=UPI00262AB16B|nr:DUF1642 domain-containing protein [uncultured Streptococcus sp.]